MIEKLSIVATFFCLWLTSYIEEGAQYYIALGLIMSLGILHGSNDISLLGKLKNASGTSKMIYFLATYITVVIIAGVSFYFLPSLALICFILFSGYHFGEQHYHRLIKLKFPYNYLLYGIYGLFVLFLIFYLNFKGTQEIVHAITSHTINKELITIVLSTLSILLITSYGYIYYLKKLSFSKLLYEVGLLLIFAIVFQVSNLIWSFTIYFIFWHSIPSMIEQVKFLYGDTKRNSFSKYLKNSFIVWLISILGMVGMLYIVRGNETYFVSLLFSFLGAITFAHAFIISKMFKS